MKVGDVSLHGSSRSTWPDARITSFFIFPSFPSRKQKRIFCQKIPARRIHPDPAPVPAEITLAATDERKGAPLKSTENFELWGQVNKHYLCYQGFFLRYLESIMINYL
jgi:hypothetical protein